MLVLHNKMKTGVHPSHLHYCQFALMHHPVEGRLVQRRGEALVMVNTDDSWDKACCADWACDFRVEPLVKGTLLRVEKS